MADVSTLCRVSVRAQTSVFELALPVDVELAELMPAIVDLAEPGSEEAGLAHGGWILQRLGEDPLNGERTPHQLGLRDGETLHLRPYRDAMPAIHFDEVSDAIATALDDRTDSWHPGLTRALLLSLAGLALAVAALLMLHLPGSSATTLALLTVIGIAVMVGAAVVPDGGAGTVLAAVAAAYLALAAAASLPPFPDGRTVLALGSAFAACSLVGVALVEDGRPVLTAQCLAGTLAALTGLALVLGASLTGAAALGLILTSVATAALPTLSARLAGLRVPLVPANAQQLQDDIDPLPDRDTRERAARADAYLNAMFVVTGAVQGVFLTLVVLSTGWWAFALACTASLHLCLQGLPLTGRWQRLAVVLPGCYGIVLLVIRLAGQTGPWGGFVVGVCVLAAAAVAVAAAHLVPGRRFVPYWGRAADLAHSGAAVASVSLALQVMGVFGYLRMIVS